MTGSSRQTAVDMEQALLDPASVFGAPEAVLLCEALSKQQKIEILRRWEYDASETAVATEEGMPDGEKDLVHRILVALDRLAGEINVEQVGPTKQHGIPRSAVKS
ncbi:MAG: hypothetical protein P8Y71_20150 [Pseudolabrys sp.]|jgi:hypothetical protein